MFVYICAMLHTHVEMIMCHVKSTGKQQLTGSMDSLHLDPTVMTHDMALYEIPIH